MANILPVEGQVGWNRLMTEDAEKAQQFYGNLFGWVAFETEVEGISYYIFKIGPDRVAGLQQIPADLVGQITPHWMSYITVQDIEATVEKAIALGATVRTNPTKIPGLGQVALIRDPTDVYVGLYQPG